MITIFRRGRVWHARGSVRGVPIRRQSLGTQFKEVAARLAAKLELYVREDIQHFPWDGFSRDFLASCRLHAKPSTIRKYQWVLNRFSRFLKHHSIILLEEVTPETISLYVADRSRDVHPTRRNLIGPEGIRSDLRILRAAFSHARRHGLIKDNPVRGNLNTVGGKVSPFSSAEVHSMLEAAESESGRRGAAPLKPIILAFLHSGLRAGDLAGLKWSSVRDGTLAIHTRKRDKLIRVPIHPRLAEALDGIKKRGEFVFVTASGKPMRPQLLDRYLRRLWKRAGVKGGHAHRFRHTFAVAMLEQGATLYDLSNVMGISARTAENWYAPWVKELQERAGKFVKALSFEPEAQPEHSQLTETIKPLVFKALSSRG